MIPDWRTIILDLHRHSETQRLKSHTKHSRSMTERRLDFTVQIVRIIEKSIPTTTAIAPAATTPPMKIITTETIFFDFSGNQVILPPLRKLDFNIFFGLRRNSNFDKTRILYPGPRLLLLLRSCHRLPLRLPQFVRSPILIFQTPPPLFISSTNRP